MLLIAGLPLAAYGIVRLAENHFGKLPYFAANNERVNSAADAAAPGSFTFTTAGGNPMVSNSWKGRINVVNFFFTSCPVICPAMMREMKQIQESRNDVQLISITVDPAHDTPQKLQAYSAKTGYGKGNWQLLTGEKQELYRFARKGMYVTATEGDGGPEDFIHSDRLILLDNNLHIRGYYSGTSPKEVQLLLDDIKKLQHER